VGDVVVLLLLLVVFCGKFADADVVAFVAEVLVQDGSVEG
jgi:hypothetical protein